MNIAPPVLLPDPAYQRLSFAVAMRLGTCEEFGCEWFLHGREGIDDGKPFRHPAGVECGDHARCPDPNCPCPSRLRWELRNNRPTGRRGHLVPDTARPDPVTYQRAINTGRQMVTADEWLYRLHEGVDSYTTIKTRGL